MNQTFPEVSRIKKCQKFVLNQKVSRLPSLAPTSGTEVI